MSYRAEPPVAREPYTSCVGFSVACVQTPIATGTSSLTATPVSTVPPCVSSHHEIRNQAPVVTLVGQGGDEVPPACRAHVTSPAGLSRISILLPTACTMCQIGVAA